MYILLLKWFIIFPRMNIYENTNHTKKVLHLLRTWNVTKTR